MPWWLPVLIAGLAALVGLISRIAYIIIIKHRDDEDRKLLGEQFREGTEHSADQVIDFIRARQGSLEWLA